MIPLHLSLSGFLSYRDLAELDLSQVELACISGENGAGKSSLLDAITWVLFGQARKRDDSLINSQCSAARVRLVFAYEGDVYRVERIKPREKTGMIELHLLQSPGPDPARPWENGAWKPLTERSSRETEGRIQSILRLDYETFVNAAFFLQGKADQFTQQRPGDRKRILSSILGLEAWEAYRQKAGERRKQVESDITAMDARLGEIAAELAEESERRAALQRMEAELERLTGERKRQENGLEAIRKIAATLEEQSRLVDAFGRQLAASQRQLDELENRAGQRIAERSTFSATLARAAAIQAAYQGWQDARAGLERMDGVAAQFRSQEKLREAPRKEIDVEHARLAQEQRALAAQQQQASTWARDIEKQRPALLAARQSQAEAEHRLAQRGPWEHDQQEARHRQDDARQENQHLRAEMDLIKKRIQQLGDIEGSICPVCGQPLSPEHRQEQIAELNKLGKELGDRFRANQVLLKECDERVRILDDHLRGLQQVDVELRRHSSSAAGLESRLESLEAQKLAWETTGALRLSEVTGLLDSESYAGEARRRLAEIDAQLKEIGYDAAAHDALRRAEQTGRATENELRALERAQAALEPLEREIAGLEKQIAAQQTEVKRQQGEYDQAAASLAAAQAQAPDLRAAERAVLMLQEQENRLRMETGAARQKVLVLDDLKERRRRYEAQREEYARQASQYRQLERAFSKDGVPALLIEQALPEIEARANEILDRLSGGLMSVRFITQSAFKDKKRDDLRETLDIQISDNAGMRDYEMYSGGEAFRVNFAVRLALSEVLAQRAGARLQTLVIDEGFGSQDVQGRQRLIEAINLVRHDFAKILVITHIEELKEAFPNRIEVEKTERGSRVRVI